MKKSILATITVAALGLPFAASAQQLSEAQLIELAVARNICGGSEILGARYSAANTVTVTCQTVGAPAGQGGGALQGALGGPAAGAALGGLLLIAVAASDDSSSGTTTTTN